MSKNKVYAYITHANRLLVFRHVDFLEAGIQVPGGTLREGEATADGALREAQEETGLTKLTLGACLGETDWVSRDRDVTYHRTYYHLVCGDTPAERWRHDEMDPSDGNPAPIRFEFFWAPLPDGVPDLLGDLDEMMPALCRRLGLAQLEGPL